MKYLIVLLLSLSACTSKTQYGNCIGVTEDKNPKLEYKISTWNIIVGVTLFELVAPPLVVLFDEVQCPIGVKQ